MGRKSVGVAEARRQTEHKCDSMPPAAHDINYEAAHDMRVESDTVGERECDGHVAHWLRCIMMIVLYVAR